MKNELSVWNFVYRKSYYFTHPWKLFHDIYWNVRNFIHRGKYGFAYIDVWEWCSWWPKVGAAALRYMAEHGSGYPGYEPWETPEKWHEFLTSQADSLDKAAKSCDFCTEENEYKDAYFSLPRNTELTEEEKEIKEKFYARQKQIENGNDNFRANLFENIGRNLPRYWD